MELYSQCKYSPTDPIANITPDFPNTILDIY